MFIVYNTGDVLFSKNLDLIGTFALLDKQVLDYNSSSVIANYDTSEEALARFNDIVDASGTDLKVYDVRKDVGYWKPKKPGPKPKAKAPAQGNSEPTK